MLDLCTFICMNDLSFNHHRSIILRSYGQISQMSIGNRHQCHITEDATGRPIIVVVEITARELGDDTHGQLLFTPTSSPPLKGGKEIRDIEERRVIAGTP